MKKQKSDSKSIQNKILFSLVALLGVIAIAGTVFAFAGSVKVVVEGDYIEAQSSGMGMLGADASHTSGAFDAAGGFLVNGTTVISSDKGITATGDVRVKTPVKTGAIATFTVTSTATAANVCDNPLWTVTPATGTPSITLPATTTLFADCLTTNGDTLSFNVKTITTSTILAVGGGGNLDLDATATITADKSAKVTIIRDSATTYLMQVDNYNS